MNANPQTKQFPRLAAELLLLVLLLLCIAIPFKQAIFEKAPISKLDMLEKMDAVQAPSLYAPWCILDDLSSSMAHIPNEHFQRAQSSSGDLPLWNPLNGAGRPFVGEFQTLQFSFFHQIFPASSPYLYNLGLVFKVLMSAFGCYFLARIFGISRASAFTAGVAYAFCSHCLRFTELVDNYCFYPWLALAFVWFASAPALLRAFLVGLLTAACAYNMHPETFACASALAAAFAFIKLLDHSSPSLGAPSLNANSLGAPSLGAKSLGAQSLGAKSLGAQSLGAKSLGAQSLGAKSLGAQSLDAKSLGAQSLDAKSLGAQASSLLRLQALSKPLLWLTLIALISFCAAAPLVLPLAEFIANSSSYKFASHQIEHVQFSNFLLNLFSPTGSGNTYIGIALGLSLPLGMLVWYKRSRLMLAMLLAILFFSTRPFGLESLLSNKPFCYLLPEYTLYAALLLICLCAATGLDELITKTASKAKTICIALTFLSAMPCLIAQLPFLSGLLAKLTDFSPVTEPGALTLSAIAISIIWLLAGLLSEKIKANWKPALIVLAIANTVFLAMLVTRELGPRADFNYRSNSITKTLQSLDGRVIATGYNLFQPNTNLVYGIEDFRSTAPLFPSRYSQFLALGAAGAKFCTIPEAPTQLNHIYDLAGVKYILSDQSLTTPEAASSSLGTPASSRHLKSPLKLSNGLRLDRYSSNYNPTRRELFAEATFTLHNVAFGHYSCALAACDATGKPLTPIRWLNDRIEEIGSKNAKPNHKFTLSFSQAISNSIPAGSKIIAKLFVRDNWTAGLLAPPNSKSEGIAIDEFVLAPNNENDSTAIQRKENLDGGLYLFKNQNAKPPAYIAHKISLVKTASESLQAVSEKANSSSWNESVVIEDPDTSVALANLADAHSTVANSAPDQARILDRSADSVVVLAHAFSPGWLVLTDTFYPGWQAELDSKPARIFAANHMFRAVQIPAGHHIVTFKYEPASFMWGCRLLILILIASLTVLAVTLCRSQFPKHKAPDLKKLDGIETDSSNGSPAFTHELT